jgi:MoxR-like ATPase
MTTRTDTLPPTDQEIAAAAATTGRLRDALNNVLFGQETLVEMVMIGLLSRGHILLEGLPGLGKTALVKGLSRALQLQFKRVQFTPDLLPGDITGNPVLQEKDGGRVFVFQPGPLFANLVLADEINRTPPKTQSALLEAMEERQATIDGEPHALEAPFFVCATQNPIEFEGTYPLPEAQLDRFLVRVRSSYPTPAQERELLDRAAAGFDAHDLAAAGVTAAVGVDELLAAQAAVRAMHVDGSVRDYALALVLATRSAPDIALGASPRATLGLMLAAQAAAAIDGRSFVTPDDVKDVAMLVFPHRLIVRSDAELDGATADAIVERLLRSVPAPT